MSPTKASSRSAIPYKQGGAKQMAFPSKRGGVFRLASVDNRASWPEQILTLFGISDSSFAESSKGVLSVQEIL